MHARFASPRARLLAAFAFLSAFAAPFALAQEKAPTTDVKASDKCFLWHVTGDKGEGWLTGSMHATPKDFYPMPKEIEDAFKKSTQLAVEYDTEAGAEKTQLLAIEKGKYAEGDSIDKHVKKETLDALDGWCSKVGASMDVIKPLKPWLAATQVEVVAIMQLGFDITNGIDTHFLKKAAKRNKKILELESPEEQIGLLAGLSDELQEQNLLDAIKGADKQQKILGRLVDAWTAGDDAAIDKLTTEAKAESAASKAFYEKLIDERNVKMAEKIDGYLKEKGPTFVCVGAAHLVGEKGLVKLLAAKGYKVEQVKRAAKTESDSKSDKSDKSDKKEKAPAGAGGD